MTTTAAQARIGAPPSESPASADRPEAADQPSARASRWPFVFCLLGYAALVTLAYLPVGPLDTQQLPTAGAGNPAGSDPYQMVWFLAWVPYALTHGVALFHTNFIDYPTGVNLADNTTVPLLGVLGWPITATLGPVATFNFLIRLSFVVSAGSMCFVLRRWCTTWWAPFLGGLLYAFGPYASSQALHLDLIFVPIPPLLVLCADELVRRQRVRPLPLGLLIGLLGAAQFYISPDILSACLLLMLIAACGLGIRHRHLVRARWPYLQKAAMVAIAVFVALVAYPIYEMVLGPEHLLGPVIPVGALQSVHADIFGPFVPTSNQLLVPAAISHLGDNFVGGNLSENGTYLGVPLLLVLVTIIRRLRRDTVIVTFALFGGAAFLISLGPKLSIADHSAWLPLPEAVLAHIPLFDNTIPARYALFVLLFAAMILAIGTERLWVARRSAWSVSPLEDHRLRARPWAAPVLVGVVVFATLLPNVPYQNKRLPWPSVLTAAIARFVPPGTVVLTSPFPTPTDDAAMVWQATDGMQFRITGGYATVESGVGRYGQRWPPLLPPQYVQELLGDSVCCARYPTPGPATRAAEAELLAYLARYSIGAVVFWSGGTTPGMDYRYLRAALGAPPIEIAGYAIWLKGDGLWPRSTVAEPAAAK
jgi:hypothetical protein